MSDQDGGEGRGRRPDLRVLSGELEDAPVAAEPAAPINARQDAIEKEGPKLERDLALRDEGEIYPGCPVIALGVHGKEFYYLDWLGQLQAETTHTKDRMCALFGGREDVLRQWFPSFNKAGAVTTFSQDKARAQLMVACTERGVWNAFEKVRGLGAWPDDEGGCILHCGDAVLHKGVWKAPGAIEGYVYPSQPRIPRPLEDFLDAGASSPGQLALEILQTWSWLRPEIDPVLLLGWICNALFGGAIDWRALAWITGDAGTGKSTLQKLIRHIMGGEGAILQSTDATEASVRQFLMQSTIPVSLDEIEAEADGKKVQAVVKLARQAASGGVILRGGQDHKGQEFKARSAFMFTSINVPPLLDQDISRIALLELLQLGKEQVAPAIEPRHWSKVGRGLRTRILDGWPRWHETLEAYRGALARGGHNARGCDQFGTLLAMADLALHDGTPSADRCQAWAGRLSATVIDEQTDQSADWQRCLNHLFGQLVDPYQGGGKLTVGRYVMTAANYFEDEDPGRAQRVLAGVGLRVQGQRDTAQLVVANAHPGLARLFEGTHWFAPAGQRGVWAQAMKRVPGSRATTPKHFDLVQSRARCFPLSAVPALLEEKDMSEAPQAPETPSKPFNPNDFM